MCIRDRGVAVVVVEHAHLQVAGGNAVRGSGAANGGGALRRGRGAGAAAAGGQGSGHGEGKRKSRDLLVHGIVSSFDVGAPPRPGRKALIG